MAAAFALNNAEMEAARVGVRGGDGGGMERGGGEGLGVGGEVRRNG